MRWVIKECLDYEGFGTLYVLNYVICIMFHFLALLRLLDYTLYDPLCILTIFEVFVNFYAFDKFH